MTAVVGFTSSFAVVLTGLRATGASADEAASGLLVLSLTMGVGSMLFSWRTRTPVTMAWSTPGAALLAGATIPDGGYADAIGAFVVAGLLYVLTGLVRPLGELGRARSRCRSPTRCSPACCWCSASSRSARSPTTPRRSPRCSLTWLVLMRLARRWAVPGAFAAALVVIVVSGSLADVSGSDLAPTLTWTTPAPRPRDDAWRSGCRSTW